MVMNRFVRIHSRHKVEVAQRLVLGALNVVYGQQAVKFQGPFPSGFSLDTAAHTLTITFDSGNANLQIRSNDGFEVCVRVCHSVCACVCVCVCMCVCVLVWCAYVCAMCVCVVRVRECV